MIIRRIRPISCARIGGILYGAFGLVAGMVLSVSEILTGRRGPTPLEFGWDSLAGGRAFLFLPLFYGCFGFAVGMLGALLYNWLARFVGGIEIDLEE